MKLNFRSTGSGFRDTGRLPKLSYFGMDWNFATGKSSRSCTYTLFLLQGVRHWAYFALRAVLSGIRANCQKCHIWAWLLAKVPEVADMLSFSPIGWNWAYFRSTGSIFRDTGWFSNLPYLGIKLGRLQNIQKLHIYSLSTPGGRNWAYFCSMASNYQDTGRLSKWP